MLKFKLECYSIIIGLSGNIPIKPLNIRSNHKYTSRTKVSQRYNNFHNISHHIGSKICYIRV